MHKDQEYPRAGRKKREGGGVYIYQPVCLREVAVHQWLVDLGSGTEMLLFE